MFCDTLYIGQLLLLLMLGFVIKNEQCIRFSVNFETINSDSWKLSWLKMLFWHNSMNVVKNFLSHKNALYTGRYTKLLRI